MLSRFANAEVRADLECELDGRPVSISVADQQIVVEVPDVATGLALLQCGSPRGFSTRTLCRSRRWLEAIRHSLEIRVRDESIAQLGYGVANSGWALFGLRHLSFRPWRLAKAWSKSVTR